MVLEVRDWNLITHTNVYTTIESIANSLNLIMSLRVIILYELNLSWLGC